MNFHHIPVLLDETLAALNISPQGIYLDGTLGGAGHSAEILKRLSGGNLIGVDKDAEALKAAEDKLKTENKTWKTVNRFTEFSAYNSNQILLLHADFKSVPALLNEQGILLDGVLLDLGVSSHQIDTAERGFSFRQNAPLDMRMNQEQTFSAYHVVNEYAEEKLVQIFRDFGEEEFAKSIARNIAKQRAEKPIETTGELNEIIEHSMPKKVVFSRGGAAKKVFQAIRIEVNGELDKLSECINEFLHCLKPGGRMVVISFHSLEDRIVKTVFKDKAVSCICPPHAYKCTCGNHHATVRNVGKNPITASEEEISQNSRSACAKLRVCEKI